MINKQRCNRFVSLIFVIFLFSTYVQLVEGSAVGSKLKKSQMKLNAPTNSTDFLSSMNSFISNFNNTSTQRVETSTLSANAKICYNMLQPIVDALPNFLKNAFVNHINQYATATGCGDSTIFAKEVQSYFLGNTMTISEILTKASQDAKNGMSCLNSASIAKTQIRASYDDNMTKSERLQKFKNTIDSMAHNLQSTAMNAKASLTGAAARTISTFLQMSEKERSEHKTNMQLEKNKHLASSFIQLNQNINSNYTVSFTDALLKAQVSQNLLNIQTTNPSISNSEDISVGIINKLVSDTNNVNYYMIQCILKLQQIALFRTLNLVGSHEFIDKVFDKDLAYAQKVVSSQNNVVTLSVSNNQNQQTNIVTDQYYVSGSTASLNQPVSSSKSTSLSPTQNRYIAYKKDKNENIDIGKSCFQYVNTFNSIGNSILDNFIEQCNQLMGLEECNYYGNLFNYNILTDLIDQSFISNLVTGFGLDVQKNTALETESAGKTNYDFLSSVINTFNQTDADISSKWNQCATNKQLSSAVLNDFMKRMSIASSTNKYGLSTMIGRCNINYDKILQSFSSYFVDFSITCRNMQCTATCPGCSKWDGSGILLDNDVELDLSCCNNFCGIVIKDKIQLKDGTYQDFYGAEWFYLITAEKAIPLTPLTMMKLKTAYNVFKTEQNIEAATLESQAQASSGNLVTSLLQTSESVNTTTSDSSSNSTTSPRTSFAESTQKKQYYTNDYLLNKLSDLLTIGSINTSKVINTISNKFSLLGILNLKIGSMTIEKFINTYLFSNKKGGMLSCYDGKCLAECDDSTACVIYNIQANPDTSTLINPPNSKLTFDNLANFDNTDVYNKGSSKYSYYQSGLTLSETSYQDKCIKNKNNLGSWSEGYDLIKIKYDSLISSNTFTNTLNDIKDDESQLTTKQKAYNQFYTNEDLYINNFIYNGDLANAENLSFTTVYKGLTPFYLESEEFNVIRDSLIIKSKLSMGEYSPHYLRGSEIKYTTLDKTKLSAQFNPDDWKPNFIKDQDLQSRVEYINSNFNNFEIDIQCNTIYCVLRIADILNGSDYYDFYQKEVALYDTTKLTNDQKMCMAKSLINYATENPIYFTDSTSPNSFKNIINLDNPFKNQVGLQTIANVVSAANLKPLAQTSTQSLIEKKATSQSNLTMRERIKLKEKAKLLNKAKTLQPTTLNLENSTSSTSSNKKDYSFNLDQQCGINNSPYTVFPLKPSCIRELTYTCTEAQFTNTINRFTLPSTCPAFTGCSQITNSSSDAEFEACGQLLTEIFLKTNKLTINYNELVLPCDITKTKGNSAYTIQQMRNSQSYIDSTQLSNTDIAFISGLSTLSDSSTATKMEVDGSSANAVAKASTVVAVNGKIEINSKGSSSMLSTFGLLLLGLVLALLV